MENKIFGKIMVLVAVSLMVLSGIAIVENGNGIKNEPASAVNSPSSVSWWSGIKGASLKTEYLGHTGQFIVSGNELIQFIPSSSSSTSGYVNYYNLSSGMIINNISLPAIGQISNPYIGYANSTTYLIFGGNPKANVIEINSIGVASTFAYNYSVEYWQPLPYDGTWLLNNQHSGYMKWATKMAEVLGPYIILPHFRFVQENLGGVYQNITSWASEWEGHIQYVNLSIYGYITGFQIIDPITNMNVSTSIPQVAQWETQAWVWNDSTPSSLAQGGSFSYGNMPTYQEFFYMNNAIYFITTNTNVVADIPASAPTQSFNIWGNYSGTDIYQIYPESNPSGNIINISNSFYLEFVNESESKQAPSSLYSFTNVNVAENTKSALLYTTFANGGGIEYVYSQNYTPGAFYNHYMGLVQIGNNSYIMTAYTPYETVYGYNYPLGPQDTASVYKVENGFRNLTPIPVNYNLSEQVVLRFLLYSGVVTDGLCIAYGPSSSNSIMYLVNSTSLNLEYSFLSPSVSATYSVGNTLYDLSNMGVLYIINLPHPIPLNVNIFGLPKNIHTSINVLNNTFNSSFSTSVLPGTIPFSISVPNGYMIENISISGPGLKLNSYLAKYDFSNMASFALNISNDPTMNITFMPIAYKVTFDSNINQGISWLTHWNLEKNVTWQVRIYHGSDPSTKIIYSNYLNNSSITNYTLIQNSSGQNMTFELFNGSYKYSVFSTTSLFITGDTGQNLTVSGLNQSLQVTFNGNYPKAVISFVPAKIPLDTAWVISGQNSSGGTGLSVTNYSWTITGPVNYILSGQSNIVYFNQVGNYTISLTVYNQYGLKNTTSTSTDIIKFTVSNEILMTVSLKGIFTNSSADYQVEVKMPKNMSIASVEAIIDNSTSMNIKFVNSSTTGNYSYYFYLASFNPSSLSYGNHFLNFSAYSTSGQFNYYHFSKTFGSTSKGSFNLMNFFGGPENFWAMIAAFIGVIITVASLKISRSTVVEIPTVKNGKEYVAETKLKSTKVKTPKKRNGGRKI